MPARDEALLRELSRLLESRRWGARELRPLLSHTDARVRTLALIGLYDLEDPLLLPDVFRSANDAAVTFPALQPFSLTTFGDPVLTPDRLLSQTVGDVAAAILKVYMETGGYSYGPFGQGEQPGFAERQSIAAVSKRDRFPGRQPRTMATRDAGQRCPAAGASAQVAERTAGLKTRHYVRDQTRRPLPDLAHRTDTSEDETCAYARAHE